MAYTHTSVKVFDKGKVGEDKLAKDKGAKPGSDIKKKKWGFPDYTFFILTTVSSSYFAAFVLGYYKNGILAPFVALVDPIIGKLVIIFIPMVSGIILIGIWQKAISWSTAKKWLIFEAVTIAVYTIILSIFPTFNMHRIITSTVENVGNGNVAHANAQKTWQEVYREFFTGVGHTGGDDKDNDGSIYTAIHGKEVFAGDRCTVIDNDFEVWGNQTWLKYSKGKRVSIDTIQPDSRLTFRNKKGQKFTVVVERLMEQKI